MQTNAINNYISINSFLTKHDRNISKVENLKIQVILQQQKNHKSDEDHNHSITTKRYYDSNNNYHHRHHHHHQDMSTMVNLEDSSLFFGHRFSSYERKRLAIDYETLENNIYTQAIAECGKVGIDSDVDVGASSIGGGDNNNIIITLDSIADFVFQKFTKKD